MKEIPLTRGYVAIVDDEDFEWLSKFKWNAIESNPGYVRASRRVRVDGNKWGTSYMHREIMAAPIGMYVDHINLNPLDNRKCNLRICTNAENSRNQGKRKRNTTGFCGVVKHGSGFSARIWVDYKPIYLGSYRTAEEAAKVYDEAAEIYHGQFAKTNFQ
jgi:hypothetical protein